MQLRIPTLQSRCKVQVKWRVVFGNNLWVGPRSDEFSEEFWWCRKGLINWPNFVKTELLKQQAVDNAVTMTIDIIKATITPVDEMGRELKFSPKRLPNHLQFGGQAALQNMLASSGGDNSVIAKR